MSGSGSGILSDFWGLEESGVVFASGSSGLILCLICGLLGLFCLGFTGLTGLGQMYWDEIWTLEIDCCIMILNFFPRFICAHELSNFAPVPKTMS